MITEEMTLNKALLENFKKEMRLLGEAHAGHTEHLARTEAELKQRFKDVEHQIMVLDVKVHMRIGALDKKTDALGKTVGALGKTVGALGKKTDTLDKKTNALGKKTDALGKKTDALGKTVDALGKKTDALDHKIDVLDTKFDVMTTELSRITTHFGLNGENPRRGHLQRATTQRRKTR